MCGIYGLSWRDGRIDSEQALAAARVMQMSLGHRGPDGAGQVVRDGLILGHVRLAIIDLAGGAQPMTSPDGQVHLSYNGECYNFPDLMDNLKASGWKFASQCDSEVLLAGYCIHGSQFDEKLNGMYAYAMLDERSGRQVQLATDPVGIKPLFLYTDDQVFLFASELQAVVAALRALGRPIVSDPAAVESYLRLGWVPAPLAMIKGARKLLPGERWALDLDRWVAKATSVRARPASEAFSGTSEDLDQELAARLGRIMRRQTISDVPLGMFLSGGVDSSLLLSIACEQGLAAKSFTISFVGDGHGVAQANEADVAQAVARHLGAPLNLIEIDAAMLRNSLGSALDAMDQPLADPACLPLLLLSRAARESVTVCLSGDGGDELFAGYPRHRMARWKAAWQMIPAPLRGVADVAASLLPTAPSKGFQEKLRKAHVGHAMLASPFYIDGPFARTGQLADRGLEPWNRANFSDARSLMWADMEGQLAGQMLPKTDNMTMAASLECRVPLLDLELVELAAGLPLGMKSARGTGKLPLRRLLSRYLPATITGRPKHGFRVPLTDWFRGSMADELRDTLLRPSDELQAVLPMEEITAVVEDHLSGRAEHSIRIWTLLAYDRWQRRTLAT